MNTKPGLRTLKKLSWALAASSLLSAAAFADTGGVPQASLNLNGSSMSYCHTVKNTWEVTKTVDGQASETVNTGTSVVWSVTATKNNGGPPPNSTFCVEGTLVIWNSGAAPATIGNIVVNAQKRVVIAGKQRWVSGSVDIADKTNRDLATQAKVVAAATQEDPSWNTSINSPATYTVSGGVGTFKENAASGSIEFADADWNDALANNAYVIGPNATVTLNYKANFDGVLLGLNPAGDHIRTEVLVTFGNAGGRGGSGASIDNVDINGSGGLDADENHVRTVPVRASLDVPALEQCNPSVTLTDVLTASGTSVEITQNDFDSNGKATPSTTTTYTMTTTLTGAGTVTNSVSLDGTETACCDAAHDSASATVTVTDICLPGDPRPQCCAGPSCNCQCGFNEETQRCLPCQGPNCTLTQGAYNINANGIGNAQMAYFPSTFANGLKLGDQGGPDGFHTPGVPNASQTADDGWTAYWTNDVNGVGVNALRSFIGGGGGPVAALGADYTNPNTLAGRQAISQVLALTLSVGYSSAGVMIHTTSPLTFGSTNLANVMFCKNGTPCSTPMSVSEFLDIANLVISGKTVAGWSLGDLITVADGFNEGYDECVGKDVTWRNSHVVQ